jgi:hypothetical protein
MIFPTYLLSKNFSHFFSRINPSPTFRQKASSQHTTITNLIENSWLTQKLNPKCFLQGSYRRQTSIYTINDIDIIVLCQALSFGRDTNSYSSSSKHWTRDEIFEVMPEEYEVQLSRLVAQAAAQLTQQNQSAAAQQQAQQQAQDPIIQMQMKELQLQEQEIVRKTQKDQADIALRQEQLDIDRQRVEGQLEIDGTRLGVQIEKDKDAADRKEEYEGTKLGIDMMRSKEQNQNQRLQTAAQLLTAAQNRNSNNKKGS